jgi:hypothetical protein
MAPKPSCKRLVKSEKSVDGQSFKGFGFLEFPSLAYVTPGEIQNKVWGRALVLKRASGPDTIG